MSDFQILSSIGEGAFGEVFLVKYLTDGKLYALKQIDKQHISKFQKQHHVFKEKLVLQSVHSKYIVKLFGTF